MAAHRPVQEYAREFCGAPTKSTGKPCKRRPEAGGTVCKLHGGALPGVKRAAAFRLARDKAQQEVLERLKAEKAGKVEIITEMDRLAAEAIAWKDIARANIEKMGDPSTWRYEGKTGEQLHAFISLYERSLDRCNAVLSTNVKLGIAERKAELDKQTAILVAGVIRAIIGRLELSGDQKRSVPRIVQEEMMAISGVIQGELVA